MPKWLQGLEDTTFFFWRDEVALTWAQAIAFIPSTGFLYYAARRMFAGSESLIGWRTVPVLLEVFVAFVLLSTAGRLGAIKDWGPKLVRLLTIHLNLVLVLLAVNMVWLWADFMPTLFLIALVPNILISLLFAVYTFERRRGEHESWGWLVSSAIVVTLINTFMTQFSVLPTQR